MRLYTSRDDERRDVFDLNQGRVERCVERDRPEWIRWALQLVDGSEVLTRPKCRILKPLRGLALHALHAEGSWKGVLGRCTPRPARN